MRNWVKIILLLVSFVIFLPAHAEDASETLTHLLKNMHSLQADFTQSIQDKKGRTVQKSFGKMLLQRPNQFRWDVRKPIRQLMVTNGKKLWIYDPDLEQVTIRSLSKAAGETPAMLLSDENLVVGNEFSVKPIENTKSDLQWFLLVPRDRNTMIASLKLGFAGQEIRRMELRDNLGHHTVIDFLDPKMNERLPEDLFNFEIPDGIDVIDEVKN